jgi:hypothetical protein
MRNMISQNKQNFVMAKDNSITLRVYFSCTQTPCAKLRTPKRPLYKKFASIYYTLFARRGQTLFSCVSEHFKNHMESVPLEKFALSMYVHNGDLSSLKEGGRFSSLSSFHPPANEIKRQASAA